MTMTTSTSPEIEVFPDELTARAGGITMRYLKRVPADSGEIPAGHVLVHNRVRPTRRLGSRGFRAWTQVPTDSLVLCECGWAAELPAHYHYRISDFVDA